ncbi:protein HEXIM1, partial [Egretta garzetta]|uniref:protein HEXIM1 n=1 Tax=Egretta garzetta TaxID=188379 RepID=UPI00163D3B3A
MGPSAGEQQTSLGTRPPCLDSGDSRVDARSPQDDGCDQDCGAMAVACHRGGDLPFRGGGRAAAKSDDTSEEDFLEEAAEEDGGSDGMGGDGSEFLQRDFSETYERYHVESLQNMSKQELVKEYLELEKCLSRMEEENNRLRLESKKHGGETAETARVRQLELEVDRLRAEN